MPSTDTKSGLKPAPLDVLTKRLDSAASINFDEIAFLPTHTSGELEARVKLTKSILEEQKALRAKIHKWKAIIDLAIDDKDNSPAFASDNEQDNIYSHISTLYTLVVAKPYSQTDANTAYMLLKRAGTYVDLTRAGRELYSCIKYAAEVDKNIRTLEAKLTGIEKIIQLVRMRERVRQQVKTKSRPADWTVPGSEIFDEPNGTEEEESSPKRHTDKITRPAIGRDSDPTSDSATRDIRDPFKTIRGGMKPTDWQPLETPPRATRIPGATTPASPLTFIKGQDPFSVRGNETPTAVASIGTGSPQPENNKTTRVQPPVSERSMQKIDRSQALVPPVMPPVKPPTSREHKFGKTAYGLPAINTSEPRPTTAPKEESVEEARVPKQLVTANLTKAVDTPAKKKESKAKRRMKAFLRKASLFLSTTVFANASITADLKNLNEPVPVVDSNKDDHKETPSIIPDIPVEAQETPVVAPQPETEQPVEPVADEPSAEEQMAISHHGETLREFAQERGYKQRRGRQGIVDYIKELADDSARMNRYEADRILYVFHQRYGSVVNMTLEDIQFERENASSPTVLEILDIIEARINSGRPVGIANIQTEVSESVEVLDSMVEENAAESESAEKQVQTYKRSDRKNSPEVKIVDVSKHEQGGYILEVVGTKRRYAITAMSFMQNYTEVE